MSRSSGKFEERIVSLAPSATSILFAIGAQRSLVGVSKWCAEVAPVGRLARVGDCWKLDVREVAALRPTLIVGSVPFRAEVVAELLKLPAAFVAAGGKLLEETEMLSVESVTGGVVVRMDAHVDGDALRRVLGALAGR